MSKQVTKEWQNIDYTNTAAYKTIRSWKAEGITQEHKLESLSEWGQLQRLRKIDSILKADKGIERVITMLTRQIIKQKDKVGKTVSKEVLTIGGEWRGFSYYDEPYGMSFIEGTYRKPRMVKVYRGKQRVDSETGEDLGTWEASGSITEHTIEVPKDAAQRKKLIDKIIDNSQGDPQDIKYYFKDNLSGSRDPTFSYEQFVESDIDQLRDLSKKGLGKLGPGVHLDRDGRMRDRDNNLV